VEHDARHLVVRTSTTAEGWVALVLTDLTDVRRVEALRRDFVTNASHELKTPVAGIQALSESLAFALDRSPDRARAMIRRLQIESERLSQLVRDLLDLSRLEEGDAPARRQRVDLGQLVYVQLDRLSRYAADRDVKLHVDCPTPVRVVGNPADLRLIVANLLENAVQYNRAGGEARARLRREDATVVLEVADTGVGIPEADLDRVFERFYRVDKARSRLAGGTGLGLSIALHRVALPVADAG
jgi:signal transduction histidine kinase